MEAALWEWLVYIVRWTHVIAAIAWLGFYFHIQQIGNFMKRRKQADPDAWGEAWAMRGGGAFRTVRYLHRPSGMDPYPVMWYIWQNATLIVSGYLLLTLVFYAHADLYMIDPAVMKLKTWQAITISFAGIVLAWISHETISRSPIRRNEVVHLGVEFAILVGLSFFYAHIFSGRGVYMQMAATIGAYVIQSFLMNSLPGLIRIYNDPERKRPPQEIVNWAAMKSRHRNYLVLALIFLMMAGHFPILYASQDGWVNIPLIVLSSAVIRYWLGYYHATGKRLIWPLGLAVLAMASVVFVSATGRPQIEAYQESRSTEQAGQQEAAAVELIVSRCAMCHTAEPTWPGLSTPPAGVVLDNPDDIRHWAPQIERFAVLSIAMPPANVTYVSLEERAVIGRWIAALD